MKKKPTDISFGTLPAPPLGIVDYLIGAEILFLAILILYMGVR